MMTPASPFNFSGKVALVTGGTRGIGKELTTSLAQHGARVYFCGTNQELGETVARDRAADPRVLVNDAETLLQCVTAGLGKSLLPVAIGEQMPGLVRIGKCPKAQSRELWLMVHPDLRDLIRVRVVMDWIMATVERLPLPDQGSISTN